MSGAQDAACSPILAGIYARNANGMLKNVEIRGAAISARPDCDSGIGLLAESGPQQVFARLFDGRSAVTLNGFVVEDFGRAAVVASWLEDPDEPGSWQADYEPLAVEGDVFVAHGRTRYLTDDRREVDREFANVFVCRFDDDGRCREFTEYYMRRQPEAPTAEG